VTSVTIRTPAGLIEGRTSAQGAVFHGVPYAVTPTGIERFRAPTPRSRWAGVRDGTRGWGTAPQPPRSQFGRLDLSPFFAPGWVPTDEYLTASIWTPDTRGRFPVVVFLHGGAFIAGSASAPAYEGSTFARDGIVFVAINYRLGIPGFLRLPDAPDNRGLLDALAALHWVRDSIAAFGGDPEQVTIMGQSAGAILVQAIAGTPSAEGLFSRAISQSGSPFGVLNAIQSERVTDAVTKGLGSSATAAALADVSDTDLVEISTSLADVAVATDTRRAPLDGIIRFGLVSEESLLSGLETGPAATRPMLLGSNLDEAALYPDPSDQGSPEDALLATARRLSSFPSAVLGTYRAAYPDATAEELRTLIRSDSMFGCGTRLVADLHSRSAPTYVYEFDWRSDALDGRLGASHLMELPFVFDRASDPAFTGATRLLGTGSLPVDAGKRMHAAWVRFIRGEDPGWDEYQPGSRIVRQIGENWKSTPHHRSVLLDAWATRQSGVDAPNESRKANQWT
jgi:para-nitrobenzyl esterase